jgi:cytochrome c-type biogenesis protein
LAGPATSIVNWVAGGIVILLGLNFIFDFWSFLSFEKRFQVRKTPTNAVSSGLFGMAFAAGWSPCIGPILSSILLLAGSTGSAGRGVLLLSLYSLGLGLPFLLAGFFSARVLPGLQKLKPYLPAIKTASGVLLVGLGLLILSGALQQFNTTLFSAAYSLQQWEQAHPMAARIIMGASLLVIAGLLAVLYLRRLQKDGALGSDAVKGSAPQPGGTQVAQARRVRPVRIGFIAAFAAVSVLTFAGVIDFSAFLAAWLNFQGI